MSNDVTVKGLRETRRKIRGLPDDLRADVRSSNNRIAAAVGDEARTRFTALGRQGPLVGASLRSRTGDTPTIVLGGTRRVGANKKPVFKLMYGTEFGANYLKQFHAPHTGTVGRALFPTIRARAGYMVAEWNRAVSQALRAAASGGDGAEEVLT